MTVAQGLVRLYPRAFRDRWGTDLAVEVRTSGPRSWPNLLAGVADMWLHPAAWPARSAAQRQARVVAMAVIVTGIGWFAAHLMVEGTRGLPRMLDVSAVAVVAGLLLAVPRPAPATLTAIGRRLLRRLAGPAVLGVAVVAVVHETGGSFVPPIRLAVLACWWGSWGWAVIQIARTIAGVGSDPAVPPRRFRFGVRVLAAAAAATGATQLVAAVTDPAPGPAALGLCLLAAPLFLRPPATAA
ncbi:hypothetical protein OG439_07275 [Amycolatopsis sp. NBC_01307]|uniref:hypothetical protein n=1 Tax=Amycolatopsis sp. NBC_01307 TaxID=2903561 RepID=UPI002E10E54A|nr:hypothetical protein OG439_07275 [Amycolatopsis sp. NBC_01307]